MYGKSSSSSVHRGVIILPPDVAHYIYIYILKQKSLATQNHVSIIFTIKINVLKMDKKLMAQVCLHVNYPIIVMLD